MAGYQPRHDTDPVWYNGQQVNTLTYASAQAGVMITAIHGWDERPDIRDVREDRAGDDGEWADNLFLGGRTITIEGEVMGSSWVNLQSRKRSLAAIFNPTSDEVLFKVPDPATVSPTTSYSDSGMTGYERVYARVIEAISFGDTLDPACQTFQVILRASDPRVYSDEVTTTSSGTSGTAARTVTVDQSGTYETAAEITCTGPVTAPWTISADDGGLSILVASRNIAANGSFAFDTRNRTVTATQSYEDTRLNVAGLTTKAIWMLNETAGTTADNYEGTSARDGTYSGGYTLNQTGPATGITSIDLNGTTGYVSLPNTSGVYDINTIEAWVRFDSLSGSDVIFDTYGSFKGFQVYRVDSKICAKAGNGSVAQDTGPSGIDSYIPLTALATGTWYRVCAYAVYNGAGSQYWVKTRVYSTVGDLVGSSTLLAGTAPQIQTSGGGRIGSTVAGGDYFDGRIAAVSGWSASDLATAEQIDDLPTDASGSTNGYRHISAEQSTWGNLGTGSTTYTFSGSGLGTGSQLSVSYRNARL